MKKTLSLFALLLCAFSAVMAQTNINGEDIGWGDTQSFLLTYIVDGQIYHQTEIEEGTTIIPLAAPVKEGYTFSGWSEIPETMPARDVTVTGSFTVNQYKLTYIVDGVEYKVIQVKYGDAITAEPAPVKEGHTFSGWSEIPETMPARDVTVTGSFTVNQYKLTYIVDGVEYYSTMLDYGAPINLIAAPIRDGQTFSGWKGAPATMPAHDVTITGSYDANTYTLTYIVDGVEYKVIQIKYGDAITAEPAPVKEGYTFSGWSEIPETMPARDVTVTGSFTINRYKLTYILDGIEYYSQTLTFGSQIVPIPEPYREGYVFSGWSGLPPTMPAHDVTSIGTLDPATYQITYIIDGEIFAIDSIAYGSVIIPIDAPEKEGYTFSGWSYIPETMPAGDITVTGSYTIIDSVNAILSDDTMAVYDISGKVVSRMTDRSELDKLPAGIYIIRVNVQNSSKIEKIIIR